MSVTMSEAGREGDDAETETETLSLRIPKPIKRELHHEAIENDTNLSAFARELLYSGWEHYKEEHGQLYNDT